MSTAQVLKARVRAEAPHTGIDAGDAKQLADGLSRSLAGTYVLYVKTQGLHWNIVGPIFYGLHKLTEDQYQDLAKAVDDIAERIRALGHPAPARLSDFLKLSAVDEMTGRQSADDMVAALITTNGASARRELA